MTKLLKQTTNETIVQGCDNCLYILKGETITIKQTDKGTPETRATFETHMSKDQLKEIIVLLFGNESTDRAITPKRKPYQKPTQPQPSQSLQDTIERGIKANPYSNSTNDAMFGRSTEETKPTKKKTTKA